MQVHVERFMTGPLETNTYVVSRHGAALVVDPSRGCDEVIAHCEGQSLSVEAIVLTHGHFDHAMGIEEVRQRFGPVDVWVHPDERVLLADPEYNGSVMIGARFRFREPTRDLTPSVGRIGSFDVDVRHIAGHSPGGCVLVFDGLAIVGDALFAGSIGRSDFPGGDGELLMAGIKDRILTLPPETVVYPGHGNRTTVAREKRLNPFLQ